MTAPSEERKPEWPNEASAVAVIDREKSERQRRESICADRRHDKVVGWASGATRGTDLKGQ